ncbi:MAG: N-acetylmuramoyl-L-alanine amidase-like domain-containing protein [Syntrophales bacterium]
MVNAQDRKIFEGLIGSFDQEKTSSEYPDQLILEIGKFFLGTPYVVRTLKTKIAEHLIVNLRECDCVTFVENVVALALLIESQQKSFHTFRKLLQKIRYRQGRLQGYSSRLHYFSDWIHDNQRKGILRDITAEIGGRPFRKILTFMTTHPDLYPPLRDAANLRRMKSLERTISKRSLFFIPKKAVSRLEDRIRNGDLVGITTNREGLDIEHVGIAVRVKNRIHLLHASSVMGKVILSKDTLHRYLAKSKTRSGLKLARVL